MRCLLFVALPLLAADPAVLDRGRREERRACLPCHSLRIIHGQRLSRAAWEKEIDKMVRWGAAVRERQALVEYLAASYGEDKPPAAPPRSEDAAQPAKP
jgi:hypothetical protein